MQKSSTIYFWLGSWQYCQKRYPLKKYFPSYVKLFIFILNIHIIFCRKNRKNVLQIEIKEWNFEAYLLTEEPISWLLLIESWKMTCTRSYGCFLIFLSNSVGLDCFLQPNVLPKHSKITVTCPKSEKKERVGSILTCPKSAKWISTLDCSKTAKWPIWKSEYFQLQRS